MARKKKDPEWFRVLFLKNAARRRPTEEEKAGAEEMVVFVRITASGNVSSITKGAYGIEQWRSSTSSYDDNVNRLRRWGYEEARHYPPPWSPNALEVNAAGKTLHRLRRITTHRGAKYAYIKDMSPGLKNHLQGLSVARLTKEQQEAESARRNAARKDHFKKGKRDLAEARKAFNKALAVRGGENALAMAARLLHRAHHRLFENKALALELWPDDLSERCLGDVGDLGELALVASSETEEE